MANIAPNHPAVKAAHTATRIVYGEQDADALEYHATALSAALTYLTTSTPDNLALIRDTPVGRALTAEGWAEGILDHMGRRLGIMSPEGIDIIRERISDDNPYRDEADHE